MRNKRQKHPSRILVRKWLSYDQSTGIFIWKKECCITTGKKRLGKIAGETPRKTGYFFIKVPGFNQIASHRLAWIYTFGQIPDDVEIDHIDGNPANNAIENLRLATSRQQKMNKRVQSNNRSGLKGAFYHSCHKGKKWRSQIKANGRYISLGYFHTPQEAHAAYREASLKYFGTFARAA